MAQAVYVVTSYVISVYVIALVPALHAGPSPHVLMLGTETKH